MDKTRRYLAFVLSFLFIIVQGIYLTSAQQVTHTISNSEDWRDVYSITHYSNLIGYSSDFLVSMRHGALLIPGLNKNEKIQVISSDDKSFVLNYPGTLKQSGFLNVEEINVQNSNIELITRLPDIKNFIIVGNSYGYNAIAVAPYAVISRSWVFFADRNNIEEIDSILASRQPSKVILYGVVDNEVALAIQKYSPEIINNDDRFKDDIEIVKKYISLKPETKQAVFTNGEFIEKGVMAGTEPILFTGKENVPDQIKDYLKNSPIEIGVLIGSDLVGAATNIRRTTGISVIVKFARGARVPAGAISTVEGLDLFYLPTPVMKLSISSAKYNSMTRNLELTYKSDSNIPVYFKGTITPEVDGVRKPIFGDKDTVFIAPGDYKTLIYSINDTIVNNLSLAIFTLYGETTSSLEKILESKINAEFITVIDRCEIKESDIALKYSKTKKALIINVKNSGSVDCWVNPEIHDLKLGNTKINIGYGQAAKILSGKQREFSIKQELSDSEISDNPKVHLITYYGERENSLVKLIDGYFELKLEYLTTTMIILIILIILILLFIFFILWKRRKDEDEYQEIKF